MSTLDAIKDGEGVSIQFVVAIEGWPNLMTDGDTAAAVTAWSGTGYTAALGGVVFRWGDGQEIRPWSKELSVPLMSFGVQPDDDDTFGRAVFGTSAGSETKLTNEADLVLTTLTVQSTSAFPSSGEINIGPERISYDSKTATTFIDCVRGLYAPFDTDGGGMPRHHSVPTFDDADVTIKPVVSTSPRSWVGRWVGIWAHQVVNGVLDVKADAVCVFAGKIVGVSDDESGWTWVEVEDVRAVIRDTVLMRDQWTAKVKDGIWLRAGLEFEAVDGYSGGSDRTANDLVVIVSGASGANQLNQGTYTYDELCSALNRWLASEYTASRLNHRITIGLANTTAGLRTMITITHGSGGLHALRLTVPDEVGRFLGWSDGLLEFLWAGGSRQEFSPQEPYRRMITWGNIPGDGSAKVEVESARGSFWDNDGYFPAELGPIPSGDIGVIQFEDGTMYLASLTGSTLTLLGGTESQPFLQQLSGKQPDIESWMSVRMSSSGSFGVKQIALLAGPLQDIVMRLLSSTGSGAYYHATYDTLPAQLGAAIPYELTSGLETDLGTLQAGTADVLVVVEKPIKLWEVLQHEFLMRAASLVWKSGTLRAAVWSTPTATTALHDLTEDNKAEPASTSATHRTPARDDDSFVFNLVKIEFNRQVRGDGESYQDSITIIDTAAMEEVGVRPVTIKARNTFSGVASSGFAVENLASYIAGWMGLFSRPLRVLRRSIDLTLYEDVAPGDHCTLTDNHVRDPATGVRGVTGKPGLILRHRADWGGFQQDASSSPMLGEVEILIFPRDRIVAYAPCAQVDETQTNGGYDAANTRLTCYAHEHSESSQPVDVSHFATNDEIRIIEIDPADPANPTTWVRTVDSVDAANNRITLDSALSSPSWDSAKRYRIISDNYADASATQKTKAYQADDADGLIEDLAQAYEYGFHASNAVTWTNDAIGEQVALHSELAWGDGAPLDVGYERDIARLVNSLANFRTAPMMAHVSNVTETQTGACVRAIKYILPIMVGPADYMTGDRKLWVRPFYRSATGASVTLRASLCRGFPIGGSRVLTSTSQPEYALVGPYESNDWTTTSTTWAAGTAHGFSCKNLDGQGFGWLVVEITQNCETRGFSLLRVGPYAEAG